MSDARFVMSRAVRYAYQEGKNDETFPPLVLFNPEGRPVGRLKKGDAVIFYNVRGEREIELTKSLTDVGFDKFPVEKGMTLHFSTMIEYYRENNIHVAFPPEVVIEDTLSEIIARHNLRQAKITEAEKAPHITYFLNGKKNEILPGEERVVVPTRKDITLFDEAPEMSIDAITEQTIDKIRDPSFNFIFVNFPNVDVVGHIENEPAIIRAVEAVDKCTGRIVEEAIKEGLIAIVTADHGTVENWLFPDGTIDTGHTTSPVPFILVDQNRKNISLRKGGELADVAPTVLDLMDIPKPVRMTGSSLIENLSLKNRNKSRVIILILDGWGENSSITGNMIARAHTPVMDRLKKMYPHTLLAAAGESVGLAPGTVGNSEAGHLHIGAGRRIYSDSVIIDRSIADGSFFHNEAFLHVIRAAKSAGNALHLLGIVSFFSSHGSINHLFALMDLAKQEGIKDVFIHAMLGRRGEAPESGANYIEKVERKAEEINLGKVVSVIGRYWSMDREENWDRIEKTYRMLVYGDGTPVAERS
ncbi:MAG TPA: alkaline phosphatase family protein [Syntrophales bacterium]|nr:alkaline phosphatase family protein [Syntrophales bacterium]